MVNTKSNNSGRTMHTALIASAMFVVMTIEASAGGTGLPWDSPIEKITAGLSGPVAFLFALGGMIVLGIRWIYGGEMGAMTRGLLSTVAGISLLVFAVDFIGGLFGVSGALFGI